MRLPFLRPKTPEADPPRSKRAAAKAGPLRTGGDDDVVAAARTRARRRLVGAVVLLAVGVIGFPILFDTQPRPLPLDTPIETPPRREAPIAQAPAPRTRPSPVTNLPADAGNEVTSPAPAPSAAAPAVVTPAPAPVPPPAASKPAAESTVAAVKPPAPAPAPAPVPAASTPAAAAAGRFVVQIGAYTDAATLREARAKVEKLGMKTYTQVIDGDSGKRTRVRLGPYGTREEADAAATKIKRAGLPAAILTL